MNLLIDELLVNEKIVDLMKNNFGNYVVQKVLKLALGSFKAKLIKAILNNIEKIGDRKLIMKWKSIVYSHINNEDIGTPNWNNNCVYNNDRRMTVQPRVYRFGCTDQVIPNSNCDSVSKRRETYHMGPSDLMQMQRDRLIYSNMINDYQEYNEQVFPQIDYQPFTENQGHVYNSSRNFGYK